MCLKLIFHNLACDVRPRVARSGYSSPIVNPYAAPNSCPQECRGKEHIAPYFRCLEHKCCMTSAEYVQTGCTSQCSPDRTTAYHVYTQWLGSTPSERALSLLDVINPDRKTNNSPVDVVVEQWEPLPTIDSYIPALRMAVPTTPAFREWRTSLLAKGSEVQQVLELMDLVETRLAEELQHKRAEHHICQRLDADWQKYRRFPNEPRPKECRNRENIEKLWKKLVQLSDLLKAAESEYQALQTPSLGVADFSGLITTLHPLVQNRGYSRCADTKQSPLHDLKETIHPLAVFRF